MNKTIKDLTILEIFEMCCMSFSDVFHLNMLDKEVTNDE